MTHEHIPRRSHNGPILLALCLFIGGAFMGRDAYIVAASSVPAGTLTTDQVWGFVAAAAIALSGVVVLLALPERLQVGADGLESIRGVFGTFRRVRPKGTIEVVMIQCKQVTSSDFVSIINDVWIDGSAGRKRLCRYPSEDSARAEALAARCAEAWDAEVVPWAKAT